LQADFYKEKETSSNVKQHCGSYFGGRMISVLGTAFGGGMIVLCNRFGGGMICVLGSDFGE
jgi:hypothetical protein